MTNAVKIASTLEPHWRAPTTTHWMIILFVLIVKVQEFTSTNKKEFTFQKGDNLNHMTRPCVRSTSHKKAMGPTSEKYG